MRDLKTMVATFLLMMLGGCASQAASSVSFQASGAATSFVPDSNRDGVPLKGREASPPPGFVDFCKRFADQCAAVPNAPDEAVLTVEALLTMRTVNLVMNEAIQPEEDRAHYGVDEYWTIPVDGFGDCDDYVAIKRRALVALGFPDSALRIAEVFTANFVRHVVLIVRTDKGNYVLDNLSNELKTPEQTDYAWIKWQDPASRSGWSSLERR